MIYDKDNLQKTMIQQLASMGGCTVLEVGCGDGTLSQALANSSRRYLAVDPDHGAIDGACRRPGRVEFFIGSGEDLPFAGSTFDVVLFVLSLHHQNSRKALMEAHRVLIPEGRLIILEPDACGEFQQFFHLFDDETDALTSAASAVHHSRFDLFCQEAFEVPADLMTCQTCFNIRLPHPRPMIPENQKSLPDSDSSGGISTRRIRSGWLTGSTYILEETF